MTPAGVKIRRVWDLQSKNIENTNTFIGNIITCYGFNHQEVLKTCFPPWLDYSLYVFCSIIVLKLITAFVLALGKRLMSFLCRRKNCCSFNCDKVNGMSGIFNCRARDKVYQRCPYISCSSWVWPTWQIWQLRHIGCTTFWFQSPLSLLVKSLFASSSDDFWSVCTFCWCNTIMRKTWQYLSSGL